jgi:hypothetical protein
MRSYEFTASWVVPADLADVAALAVDLERYPEWWPAIRAVAKLGPDTARVLLRAALPVTLDVVVDAISRQPPVLEVELSGVVEGRARWNFTESAAGTRCDYRQEVTAGGWLGAASYVARPLLTWNHRHAMASCERGMQAALCLDAPTRP